MDQLRRIAIHRSINRQHFVLGGERELVLGAGLMAGLIVFSGLSWFALGAGLAFWVVCLAILRRMAKADPEMSKVYRRHLVYKPFYPAKPDVLAEAGNVRKWKS
jgi:type IV secretion system protein TrbD